MGIYQVGDELYDRKIDYWNHITIYASINCNIPILEFVHDKKLIISVSNHIIINGHFDYLQLACKYSYIPYSNFIFDCLNNEFKIGRIINIYIHMAVIYQKY